jgi:hypothetical protein
MTTPIPVPTATGARGAMTLATRLAGRAPTADSAKGTLTTVAGGAWTPASIAGLVAWYDASNAASITASAGNVSQWNTLGGSAAGAHLVQATSTNQPKTGTRTINAKNVIDCDGSNDWMAVTFTTIAQPYTVLMVVVSDSASAGTFHDSNDAASRGQDFISSSQLALYAGSVVNSGHAMGTVAFQFVSVFNGASSVAYKNGTAGSTVNPGAQTLHGLTIGADSSRAGPLDGAYGEIVIVSGVIPSGDRTSWNTYCARWGL